MGGLHCLLVTPTCTPREQPLSPPGLAGHYAALQDLWLDIQASVDLKEETQGAPVTTPHTHTSDLPTPQSRWSSSFILFSMLSSL